MKKTKNLEVIQLGSTKFADFNYDGGGIVDDLKELRLNIDDRDIELLESIIGRVEKLRTALKLARDDQRNTVARMEAYADTKLDEFRRTLIPTRDLLSLIDDKKYQNAIRIERERLRSIMRECVHGISYDTTCPHCVQSLCEMAIPRNL